MSLTLKANDARALLRKKAAIAVCAAITAFLTYASVYAFRKPFTVARFEGKMFWGVSYQTLLIISQVAGYMLSKFSGIRFIAELKRFGRWKAALSLVIASWGALFFFAITPAPFGMIWLLLNGYFLGFLWGIVFSYVEGRKSTDLIGAVMAVSFIFSGGFTRSAGAWVMSEWHISEYWMPFMTGLLFIIPFIAFLLMMEKIPQPDPDDIAERSVREPMNAPARKKFIREFSLGLLIVVLVYVLLTVMRDIRDNYMANMWQELGYAGDKKVYTQTETITSLIVLLIMSSLVVIRRNIFAFRMVHFVIFCGLLIAGVSSLLFRHGYINGYLWMQCTGAGLYMSYIPFNCIFFERLIAVFKIRGNTGFLMYFADAFGYLGSVAVMLMKEFINVKITWSSFYSEGVIYLTFLGLAGTVISLIYFNRRFVRTKQGLI